MTTLSDAHALHTILSTLRAAQGQAALQTTWAELLGADFETADFARRHAEVVALYRAVATQIEVMPDRSRARYGRHAYHWWDAVMAPTHAWNNAINPTNFITQDALDQLDSAAELIEARMQGALDAPDADALDGLRTSCSEWLEAIADDTDLPEGLRLSLRHDLEHVIWLVDNADLFGTARAAEAGQAVVGNLAVTSVVVPPAKRGVWIARARKLINTLVTLSALLQGLETGLALAPGAADILGELAAGPSAPSAPGELGSMGSAEA